VEGCGEEQKVDRVLQIYRRERKYRSERKKV
jgi:hypothetical protein